MRLVTLTGELRLATTRDATAVVRYRRAKVEYKDGAQPAHVTGFAREVNLDLSMAGDGGERRGRRGSVVHKYSTEKNVKKNVKGFSKTLNFNLNLINCIQRESDLVKPNGYDMNGS